MRRTVPSGDDRRVIELTGSVAVTCVSCRVGAETPSEGDPVGPLRAFLVRHGDCLTALDLAAYRGLVTARRA